jgi:hypothetical protein
VAAAETVTSVPSRAEFGGPFIPGATAVVNLPRGGERFENDRATLVDDPRA